MDDQVLAHHGIKGQKWGVRRFQNEDGTRTAAGKKRYGIVDPTKQGDDHIYQVLKRQPGTKIENPQVANRINRERWGDIIKEPKLPNPTYLSGNSQKQNGSQDRRDLSDRQKTAIKVGAAVAVTALATYGAYKLNKMGKFDGLKKTGRDAVERAMKSVSKTKVSKIDVSKMSDDELRKQVARMSLERQYNKMTSKENTMQKAMKVAGGIAAATSTGLTIYNNMERIKKIATDRDKKKKDTKG